ncbi:MAG: TRAP transporter large permease subunit, partial [Proteobacteria bacterium]|nr:TRAP transporter large permease subunit [Pseudomonadota bacterium]
MVDVAISVVGTSMSLYHLISSQYLLTGLVRHINIHLGFALTLIFLVFFKSSGRIGKQLAIALIVLTVVCIGYVHAFSEPLQVRATFNTPQDLAIGVILIILVLMATFQAFGPLLVIVTGIAIGYVFAGHLFPGFLHAMEIEPERIIAELSIGLSGIYDLLTLSANFIFLFVVLGAILQTAGGTEFFLQIGRLAGGRLKSGPAMSAVVTSALVGTIMGSIGANIATTGSFTIPLMKRVGYKPEQAGAIEAAASSGGQIMPPVMGVAAFAMAGITGIPYLEIAVAAIMPALLYFFVVGLYTQFRAMALGIESHRAAAVDVRELLLRAPLL